MKYKILPHTMSVIKYGLCGFVLSCFFCSAIFAEDNVANITVLTPLKKSVNGIVTDENGKALPGVSIVEKGTSNAAVTDLNGNYNLTINGDTSVLVFTYIGYVTKEAKVGSLATINVQMETSINQLKELIVVGYGTQKKSDITSAISLVNLKGVDDKARTSVGEALASRVAGVRVVDGSGAPGKDVSVFIRGASTLSGNTQPLYVVDGVVTYSTSSIDPNNIDSITVLKDASAAGIYGAAGASNGVVLITTKKGTQGTTKVSFNTYTSVNSVIKKLPLLNTSQLVDYFGDLGVTLDPNKIKANNDWQDLIFQKGPTVGINANFSGATEKGSYFLGLGYLEEKGIVVSSGNKRYSFSTSLNQKLKDWLTLGGSLNYSRSYVSTIPDQFGAKFGGAILSALATPPFQEIFNPDGSYTASAFIGGLKNPLGYIYGQENESILNNTVGNVNFSIDLPKKFIFKTQLGVILSSNDGSTFNDPTLTAEAAAAGGIGTYSTSESSRYIFDNTLSYKNIFNEKHKLGFVIGSSMSDEYNVSSSQTKTKFATQFVHTLNAATVDGGHYTNASSWSLASYFSRVTYDFNNKYLLTASLRADGSSRLPSENRWVNFPAASIGWKVSNESFMQGIPIDLKLRAGWGSTGNLPSALYPQFGTLNVGSAVDPATGSIIPSIIPGYVAQNSDLKWETSQQSNIGFDITFLNKRINLSADYYEKNTKNLIYPVTLPAGSPNNIRIENLDGTINNKGFEFSINAAVIKTKDFNWNCIYNMSFNRNVAYGVPETLGSVVNDFRESVSITKDGLPLASFWGYISDGVDPATGDIKFRDVNKDGVVNNNDKTVIGNPLPDYTYGLINDFNYKNFDLNIVIDGSQGNDVFNVSKFTRQQMAETFNQGAEVVNRWQKPGDITDIPRATAADPNKNNRVSSRWVEDGSYLRVRDISFGYNLGAKALDLIKLSKLRFYLNFRNFLTITKYSGYSPEANAGQGSLTNLQGVDTGVYPQAKTVTFGINVEL